MWQVEIAWKASTARSAEVSFTYWRTRTISKSAYRPDSWRAAATLSSGEYAFTFENRRSMEAHALRPGWGMEGLGSPTYLKCGAGLASSDCKPKYSLQFQTIQSRSLTKHCDTTRSHGKLFLKVE